MLSFNELRLNKSKEKTNIEVEEISGKDIAVIGISLKLPMANSTEDLWHILRSGTDCIRSIPDARKEDSLKMFAALHGDQDNAKFGEAAYLDEVDKFDYLYFRLSPKEASLMDPNQRMFLETAWEAMEDAGYGGEKLVGSRTGVYVGYGSETDYKRLVALVDPSLVSMAIPGNTRPIIASRLSYLMDFRGPSMIVDTTCSSSLVAIHLACQALRNGECDQAVAGGVQIHLLPFRQAKIGIESSDGRAKTFDDSSDGTGTGEGVAAVILKPLNRAQKDKDHIYAVIKGSAINHDGSSIGITAPNAVAQEDVIVRAWKDAGVDPETISYIEAHGTGTKLGDPIEIDGIQRAFQRFTDKKSFCAVGSVKTNFGHLDNTAGIAGFLKAVLSLKHKQIPPTLHFKQPNKKIRFEESPVYVNDRLMNWEASEFPRRCGVSSFGLSGTNCHILLEEASLPPEALSADPDTLNILALSAKSKEGLKALIEKYQKYLGTHPDIRVEDLCYTANTGRGHYEHRCVLLVKDMEELQSKIQQLHSFGWDSLVEEGIFYGEHKVVPTRKEAVEERDISENEIRELTQEAEKVIHDFTTGGKKHKEILEMLSQLYIEGAYIEWEHLYKDKPIRKISLPAYPFQKRRCWIEMKKPVSKASAVYTKEMDVPLLDRCVVKTVDLEVYSTHFSVDRHWVLNEHKIAGDCVLVGTTYLEMVMEACAKDFINGTAEIKDVVFVSPLILGDHEGREVQTVIKKQKDVYEFRVVSKLEANPHQEEQWITHVEGKLCKLTDKNSKQYDLKQITEKNEDGYLVPDMNSYEKDSVFQFGPRWNNIRAMYVGDEELLSHIQMPRENVDELKDYALYPSLLDNALATMPLLSKALDKKAYSGENGIFLPFSYRGFKVYQPLPDEFYSYVRLKTDITDQSQMVSFSLAFLDAEGKVLAEIEEYSLKKAKKEQLAAGKTGEFGNLYYEVSWVPYPMNQRKLAGEEQKVSWMKSVLIFEDEKGMADKIVSRLSEQDIHVMRVKIGSEYDRNGNQFVIRPVKEDYFRLFEEMKSINIDTILHMSTICLKGAGEDIEALDQTQKRGIESLFYITKAVLNTDSHQKVDILLVSEYAAEVDGLEKEIVPGHATLFGLGKVVGEEYSNIQVRCIDMDENVTVDEMMDELGCKEEVYQVAYRNGIRYAEEFKKVNIFDMPHRQLEFKSDGVYIVTGGMGGIGLEISKHLASKGKVNLALINRSSMPDVAQWEEILEKNEDQKLCNKIIAVKEMEALGAKLTCIAADIASEDEMKTVINRLRERYGNINGVIHSAGVAGDGFIIKKEEVDCQAVLSPKVKGTWLLDCLTRQDELDFFVMFSSNNTLMGVPGQGDYTAANTYLGSFADYRNKKGKPTVTIQWPAWKETGMAVDHGVNFDSIFKAISTSQAVQAFDEILNRSVKRIVVGELNPGGSIHGKTISDVKMKIAEEIKARFTKKSMDQKLKPVHQVGNTVPNVKLRGSKEENYSEVELDIAKIWKEVLGFEEFNIHDNFFEIGGDSILITKVHELLEEMYPGKVSVADLFTYTSIAKLSQYMKEDEVPEQLKEKKVEHSEEDIEKDIAALLDEFEKGTMDMDKAIEAYKTLGG